MPRLKNAIYLLPLLASLCVLFSPSILRGRVPLNADWLNHHFYPWKTSEVRPANTELDDPALNVYPLQAAAARKLKQGRVPLWESGICAGFPLLADNTSFPLSPFRLALLWLPFPAAFAIGAIAQYLVLGLGVYHLARQLGQSREAAGLASLVVCLSETCVVWMEFQFWLGAACWVPWMTLFMMRFLRSGAARHLAWAGAGVGFSFLGGQLQVAAYGLVFSVLAALVLARHGDTASLLPSPRALSRAAMAAALGLCLAAPQLLPTLELVGQGERSPGRYARQNHIRAPELLAFVLPDFFGNPGSGDYAGDVLLQTSYLGKHGGYIGTLALALAALAIARRRSRSVRFFAACAAGIVLALLALRPGLHRAIADLLPAFGQVHHKRLLFFYALSAGMLAGFGLDAFNRSTPAQQRRSVSAILAAAAALLTAVAAAQVCMVLPGPSGHGAAPPSLLSYLHDRHDHYGSLLLWPSVAFPLASLLLGALLLRVRSGPADGPADDGDSRAGRHRLLFGRHVGPFLTTRERQFVLAAALPLMLGFEMLWFGTRYNPFVDVELLYPRTGAVRWLSENLADSRLCAIDPPKPRLSPREAGKLRCAVDPDLHQVRQFLLRCDWKGAVFPPDSALPFSQSDLRGKESLLTSRYRSMMDELAAPSGPPFLVATHFRQSRSPIYDLLGVRYLVSAPRGPTDPDRGPVVYDAEVKIVENSAASPRAYVLPVNRVLSVEDPARIPHLIASGEPDWTRFALVEPGLTPPPKFQQRFSDSGPVRVHAPHDAQVDVQLPPGASGLLVLTEAWYPGWRAYSDGIRSGVFPVNLLLRGTWPHPGTRLVRWVYQPQSFVWGLCLSTIALAALAFCLAWSLVPRRAA